MVGGPRERELGWPAALGYALAAVTLIVFQTGVAPWWDPRGLGPDLVFLLMVYLWLTFPQPRTGVLAFFTGLAVDAVSSGPFGLFAGIYLASYLAARLLEEKVDPSFSVYQMLLVFVLALGKEAVLIVILLLKGGEGEFIPGFTPGAGLWARAVSLLFTTLAAPLVFGLLDYLHPFERGLKRNGPWR